MRGVLPSPGLRDPPTFPRRRRERQDHGPQSAPGTAEVLPHAQGQSPLRCRIQPHAIRAGKYDHFALRAHMKSLGISLRSATEPIDDTSTGKLMEGVLASFAQFDNDVRSDRTRAGMKAALDLGRWTFLAPIGYINVPRTYGKSLIPDPERASIVLQ